MGRHSRRVTSRGDSSALPRRGQPGAVTPAPADAVWDAGERGCGELLLELKMRVERLQPGQVFELIARDPGAPADLPAWCRLTGHALIEERHPVYRIRRKES